MHELSTISQIPAGASMGNIRHVTSLTLMLLDCDHLGNGGLQHADVPDYRSPHGQPWFPYFLFSLWFFFWVFALSFGLPCWCFCSA
jgi:hypothetical protein